jgi:HD-GYP domain-containing protein (c-di-GMP phosphodiesterase class II)
LDVVYTPERHLQAYYSHSGRQLYNLFCSGKSVSQETRQKLRENVRQLILTMFGLTENEADLEINQKHARSILSEFLMQDDPPEWLIDLVSDFRKGRSSRTHHGDCATIGGLLSIGLCLGEPANVTMAGMFHDLGLAELTLDPKKNVESMNHEELMEWQSHPMKSLEVLNKTRADIPPEVFAAILHHHERWNGQGFPNGLAENSISIAGQIVAIADALEYRTAKKPFTVGELTAELTEMERNGTFDPDLIRQIRVLVEEGGRKSSPGDGGTRRERKYGRTGS